MKIIKSKDGTTIAFAKTGIGPPLVLVHGTTADHSRWAPVLSSFERKFTVYAMDRRGRGASGDVAPYAIANEFDDVAALVDSVGEPVVLLGHSYGALCSLEAALRTKNVKALVLYEPPIPAGVEIYLTNVIERLEALIENGQAADVVTGFFADVARMAADELNMLKALPNWPARVAAARTIPREMRASEAYHFHAARFAGLNVPTLLLLGGASPAFFKAAIDLVHAGLPSSRVVVLPGQQHQAINTATELFVREVLAFAAEVLR